VGQCPTWWPPCRT